MCFRDDDGDPDIWLTIEGGRFVPAPPMVYMPGLRQVQDRVHRRAYPSVPPLACGGDFVRLPPNLTTPKSLNMTIPATTPVRPPAEKPATEPIVSPLTDQSTSSATPLPDTTSTEAPKVLETPPGDPPAATPEPQPEVQPDNATPGDPSTPGSTDSVESTTTTSTDPPPSPSPSSSSSLRSILKKHTPSTTEGTESENSAGASGEDNEHNETEPKNPKRPKTKKSVSFTDETAPPALSPMGTGNSPPRSAAAEGAAIARRLVERENASQGGRRGAQRVGGADGSADLPGGRQMRQGPDKTILDRNTKEKGKIRGGVKQAGVAGSDGGGSGVAKEAPERHFMAGGQRTAGLRLTRYWFVDEEEEEEEEEEDESNVDDEIPGRWP